GRGSGRRWRKRVGKDDEIGNQGLGIRNSIPDSPFLIPNSMFCPRPLYTIPLPARGALHLGERTLVMGILNVTPDSFAEPIVRLDPAAAVDAALQMEADGADMIDIGGESTRPGAELVSAEVERD